jgi:hypothetical protein
MKSYIRPDSAYESDALALKGVPSRAHFIQVLDRYPTKDWFFIWLCK